MCDFFFFLTKGHITRPCKGAVINYGEGAIKRVGEHVKFYPYNKGGRTSFNHTEGGGSFHPLKGGVAKSFITKDFVPAIFPFCSLTAPPPPSLLVING